MSVDSCLVRRLEKYIELSAGERESIAAMERDERPLDTGMQIDFAPDGTGELAVLNGGWALGKVRIGDREAVTRIYIPGEIIGLPEMGADSSLQTLCMLTPGAVCPFPQSRMGDVIRTLPRLAGLFVAIAGLEQLTLRDRFAMLALRPVEDRLVHFLLDLRARLLVANVGSGNRFRVPMTQTQIGAAIGATSVSVNRALGEIVRRGWVHVERPYYRVLEREAMEGSIGYVDRYASLDVSWIPRC